MRQRVYMRVENLAFLACFTFMLVFATFFSSLNQSVFTLTEMVRFRAIFVSGKALPRRNTGSISRGSNAALRENRAEDAR